MGVPLRNWDELIPYWSLFVPVSHFLNVKSYSDVKFVPWLVVILVSQLR